MSELSLSDYIRSRSQLREHVHVRVCVFVRTSVWTSLCWMLSVSAAHVAMQLEATPNIMSFIFEFIIAPCARVCVVCVFCAEFAPHMSEVIAYSFLLNIPQQRIHVWWGISCPLRSYAGHVVQSKANQIMGVRL